MKTSLGEKILFVIFVSAIIVLATTTEVTTKESNSQIKAAEIIADAIRQPVKCEVGLNE